jgi:hypothetical protein
MWRMPLPVNQTTPITVLTTPDEVTYIELPYPVVDWLGRGFAVNIDAAAADFHLRLRKGDRRVGITPLIKGANRLLHLVLSNDSTISLSFVPAVDRESACRAIYFYDSIAANKATADAVERERTIVVSPMVKSSSPPESMYKASSSRAQEGLVNVLRLVVGLPEARVSQFAKANPALEIANHPGNRLPADGYDLAVRCVVRDSITDTIGLAVAVRNTTTGRNIVLDPAGWSIRVGQRVYPIGTGAGSSVVFPGMLAPGATSMAYLILARSVDGSVTRLLAENDFRVTATPVVSELAYPVIGTNLDFLKLEENK